MPDMLGLTDPTLIAERQEFLSRRQGSERSTSRPVDPQTGTVLMDGEMYRPDPSDFGPRVDFSRR